MGRIDPTLYLSETNEDLYDVPMDHLGRIWFTVSYDETAEQLRIIIHKARNLRSPHYQSLRGSAGIMSNDMTSLSLLTPAPTQDCRIRWVSDVKFNFQKSRSISVALVLMFPCFGALQQRGSMLNRRDFEHQIRFHGIQMGSHYRDFWSSAAFHNVSLMKGPKRLTLIKPKWPQFRKLSYLIFFQIALKIIVNFTCHVIFFQKNLRKICSPCYFSFFSTAMRSF